MEHEMTIRVRSASQITGLNPRRPSLRYLPPEGSGSRNVESLPSVLARMAENHWMLPRVFAQRVVAEYPPHGRDVRVAEGVFKEYAHTLCGTGQSAQRVADAVGTGTGFNDYDQCHLGSWRHLFPRTQAGLVRPQSTWCPLCLNDDGERPYHRLLWAIQDVAACPTHLVVLESRCANCGQHQPMLAKSPCWYLCQHCGFDLRRSAAAAPACPRQQWIAQAIADFIGVTCASGVAACERRFARNFRAVVDGLDAGFVEKVAADLYISSDEVRRWAAGVSRPHPGTFWALCYNLRTPPAALLGDTLPIITDDRTNLPATTVAGRSNRPQCRVDRIDLERRIQEYLQTRPDCPPSAREVGRHVGTSYMVIKYHFPDVYQEICDRYAAYVHGCHLVHLADSLAQIDQFCQSLLDEGIYPTERKLKERFGMRPSRLRQTAIRDRLTDWQRNRFSEQSAWIPPPASDVNNNDT